ncbi:hypothetical protein NS1_17 [Citrobacter phage NS1]
MIKLIEFLGRLVVRGYRRAAVMERKVAEKTADGAADAAARRIVCASSLLTLTYTHVRLTRKPSNSRSSSRL